jgi:pimeloyl-ACP methyl ester carboxylesterase
MRVLDLAGDDGGDSRCLIVLLPGLGDSPEDYRANGFDTQLRAAGVRAHVTAADAHFGYYRERVFVDRFEEDVLAPARERYDRTWLVGISLGGMGALAATAAKPDAVDGLVLIAPYLGSGAILDEIEAAGGPLPWRSHAPPIPERFWDGDEDTFFRATWTFAAKPERADGSPVEVHLGYGRDDRFAKAQAMLASALPERSVRVAAGGHRWPVWKDLFHAFVREGFLQRSCNRDP